MTENPWTAACPAAAGYWNMRCDETPDEVELVAVAWGAALPGQAMVLWAVNCSVGTVPIKVYHEGLTSTRWQFVRPLDAH
jgi:hypothetical protein